MEYIKSKKFNLDIYNIDSNLFEWVGDDVKQAEHIYTKPYSYWKTVFKKAFSSYLFITCFSLLVIFLLMSFTIAVGKPAVPLLSQPSLPHGPSAQHWFGTGKLGEDIWNKVWIGSRTTLFFAAMVFSIQIVLGLIIGAIWGFYAKLDMLFLEVTRFITIIPDMILWLVIIFLAGGEKGVGIIVFAVSITSWIGLASLMRIQIILTKQTEYNIASKVLGTSGPKVIKNNILPKILPIVIQEIAFALPAAISIDSGLAYLGYGFIQPNKLEKASLGSILNEVLSDNSWQEYPYLLIVPLVFVGGISLLFYMMGKVLADSLDPKTHR
ncbi:oligopeptide ABC transporter permease [Entomoplasma ellychniae]|uniref:Oligopeptide ABC transporter permease n=1 Tax=Entomoplasma ellychniae TaxID=2114 RepID=A0A8E2QZJ7_9MOLU|nr:oligopeptide ABC transporter permease OppC [Entomoplasma ellychniae]PPE04750.1 oligopeptide ABC transporter permease [Entomoplasma ellychniae]